MMGTPDDDARTVNSDVDQTYVIEAPDDMETVDETESELSPSSPEAMLREVANDATASIEYVHQFPRAFSQSHVEAAFQAQHTETRLMYVAVLYVGGFFFFFSGFMLDLLQAIFELGPKQTHLELSIVIGLSASAIFLLASLGLLCNQTKLHDHHHAVAALLNFTFVSVSVTASSVTLFAAGNGGFAIPISAAYVSGLMLAGGTFVMAHTEASLWAFLSSAAFGVAVCMTPGAGLSPIVGTISTAVVLGSISRQIMFQHRHSFAAQVRHQLCDVFHSF